MIDFLKSKSAVVVVVAVVLCLTGRLDVDAAVALVLGAVALDNPLPQVRAAVDSARARVGV